MFDLQIVGEYLVLGLWVEWFRFKPVSSHPRSRTIFAFPSCHRTICLYGSSTARLLAPNSPGPHRLHNNGLRTARTTSLTQPTLRTS